MNQEKIVLGGGCFWCFDALYRQVRGVTKVVSGYAGGKEPNPTYESTHGIHNSHAEVVQITFDPEIITTETILEIFWTMHDPTTQNQQGYDVGAEYRSIILFADSKQEAAIRHSVETIAKKIWKNNITTEVKRIDIFWPAEDYHQDWYEKRPEQGYCKIIIDPKIIKLRKKFADLLIN